MSNDLVVHSARAHAVLSASGTKRWWNCPGSVRATKGMDGTSSQWADLGTAAHELANACLDERLPAYHFIGSLFNGMEVTEEIADAVQVYIDVCNEYMGLDWEYYVERKFTLEKLGPPVDMFGTADFVSWHRYYHRLVVVDYKNGFRQVDVTDNPQLRYYALGALYAFDEMPQISDIEIVIVQPNSYGPPIKREIFSVVELIEWSIELMDRAVATQEPDAPLNPGSWCAETFCPLNGKCLAQAKRAVEVAEIEFAEFVEPEPKRDLVFPNIETLTPDQLEIMLPRLDDFEAWAKAVREKALHFVERGGYIGGQKLVPKRATQRWKDEEATIKYLYGAGIDEVYQKKVISPAVARTLLTDMVIEDSNVTLTKKSAEAEARKLLSSFIEEKSSGNKLVADADPRTGVIANVYTDFGEPEALPAISFELVI